MCEHGINIEQMKLAVGQADDAIALAQQWLEQLHHLADHGHQPARAARTSRRPACCSARRAPSSTPRSTRSRAAGETDVSVELV